MNATSAKPPRFFYGWVIVWSMCAYTAVVMSMGWSNIGFFIRPMSDELGFDQASFGWMSTARILGSAVTGAILGRMLDRHGPRFILAAVGVFAGMLMVAMGFVRNAAEAIAIFAMMGLLGVQGGGSLLTMITPVKWFVRKRARAVAYVYLGIPLGILFAFPLTQWLIDVWGWRAAWMALGVGGMAVMIPLALLTLRRQPEDYGLHPDGIEPPRTPLSGQAASTGHAAVEQQWTRGEGLRTVAFWTLTLAFGIQIFSMSTLNVFRVPYLQEQGISHRLVSMIGITDGVTAIVVALAMGIIVARFGGRRVAVAGFLLLAINNVLVILTHGPLLMFTASSVWGTSLAMLSVIQNTIYADYFGRQHVGSIRGMSLMFIMLFAAAGAPLAGYVRDFTGDIRPLWWAAGGALVISAVLIALTPVPRRRVDAATVREASPQPSPDKLERGPAYPPSRLPGGS